VDVVGAIDGGVTIFAVVGATDEVVTGFLVVVVVVVTGFFVVVVVVVVSLSFPLKNPEIPLKNPPFFFVVVSGATVVVVVVVGVVRIGGRGLKSESE
jgi:hypothetical protein